MFYLPHRNYILDIQPEQESICCHRTQVALRLLTGSIEDWLAFVKGETGNNGGGSSNSSGGEQERHQQRLVDEYLKSHILEAFQRHARHSLDELSFVPSSFSYSRETDVNTSGKKGERKEGHGDGDGDGPGEKVGEMSAAQAMLRKRWTQILMLFEKSISEINSRR